jgi:LysR family hydrogen peroxide-inducible transcriptional activator
MTTVQLEYIIALDTHRNFVKAAEHCFVTQPTLSMQVQKLEEELGVELFDRSRQPIVPTELGIEIIEQARVALQETNRIKEIISDRKGEVSGVLRLGIIPTLAPYLLPLFLGGFLEKYKKVTLSVFELTTEQIINGLNNETIDCGILATPLKEAKIKEFPLFYEPFVAYVSKKSSLFGNTTLRAEEIEPEEVWVLTEGHCMRSQVLNICSDRSRASAAFNLDYQTGSLETLKRMVETNRGFTILPELATLDFSARQRGMVRYFRSPEPVREISMVVRRNHVKKKLLTLLSTEIMEVVPEKMMKKEKKVVMDI